MLLAPGLIAAISGAPLAQQSQEPQLSLEPTDSPILVHVSAQMGGEMPVLAVPLLLRGAPLQLSVSLGNAAAMARWRRELDHHNAVQVATVAGAVPPPPPKDPPVAEEFLKLPTLRAGWLDFLEVTVERIDSGAPPEIVVPAAQTREAFLVSDHREEPATALTRWSQIGVGGRLPAREVADLPNGQLQVVVVFDTRSCDEPHVWKGRVEATLGPLTLRDPASAQERCSVIFYDLFLFPGSPQDPAADRSRIESILLIDPSYRGYEAWTRLGDELWQQGDDAGAAAAWENYAQLSGIRNRSNCWYWLGRIEGMKAAPKELRRMSSVPSRK